MRFTIPSRVAAPPKFSSSSSHKKWVQIEVSHLPTELRPKMCLQSAGDVLFVPEMWSSGMVSIDETVGFLFALEAARGEAGRIRAMLAEAKARGDLKSEEEALRRSISHHEDTHGTTLGDVGAGARLFRSKLLSPRS